MGPAKQKRATEMTLAKEDASKFLAEPSETETLWVEELRALPCERVSRIRNDTLVKEGMKPRHCHTNSSAMEARNPGRLKMVSGWIMHADVLVFHSVIEEQGQLYCVTPADDDSEFFDFVRDPKIVWRERGDTVLARRDGKEVPYVLRLDPAAVIARYLKYMEHLDQGLWVSFANSMLRF